MTSRRAPAVDEATERRIADLYRNHGLQHSALARRFGVSRHAIADVLNRAGIATRRPGEQFWSEP